MGNGQLHLLAGSFYVSRVDLEDVIETVLVQDPEDCMFQEYTVETTNTDEVGYCFCLVGEPQDLMQWWAEHRIHTASGALLNYVMDLPGVLYGKRPGSVQIIFFRGSNFTAKTVCMLQGSYVGGAVAGGAKRERLQVDAGMNTVQYNFEVHPKTSQWSDTVPWTAEDDDDDGDDDDD
eukprot:2120634-Karenia_brevis.AAC.1